MRTLKILIFVVSTCLLPGVCICQVNPQCGCYACQMVRQGQSCAPVIGCSCSICVSVRQVRAPAHVYSRTCNCTICTAARQSWTYGAHSGNCACSGCVAARQQVCPAPVQPVCPTPVTAAPCSTSCGAGPKCSRASKVGLMFDWGVRVSSVVNGVENVPASMRTVGDVVVEPNNVEFGPITSLLTKGLGFSTGDPDCGQFRIGARPEIVLSPHSSSNTNIFNWGRIGTRRQSINQGNYANAYYGAQFDDWVVPEYLMEYQKRPWTVGLAYKQYSMSATRGLSNSEDEPTMLQKYGLGKLQTFTLYGRYKGFELGYNFFNKTFDDSNGPNIKTGVPVTVGYSF